MRGFMQQRLHDKVRSIIAPDPGATMTEKVAWFREELGKWSMDDLRDLCIGYAIPVDRIDIAVAAVKLGTDMETIEEVLQDEKADDEEDGLLW